MVELDPKISKGYSVEELRKHYKNGTLRKLPGIGAKKEEQIISFFKESLTDAPIVKPPPQLPDERSIQYELLDYYKLIWGRMKDDDRKKLKNMTSNLDQSYKRSVHQDVTWLKEIVATDHFKYQLVKHWVEHYTELQKPKKEKSTLRSKNENDITQGSWPDSDDNDDANNEDDDLSQLLIPDTIRQSPTLLQILPRVSIKSVDTTALNNRWWGEFSTKRYEAIIKAILIQIYDKDTYQKKSDVTFRLCQHGVNTYNLKSELVEQMIVKFIKNGELILVANINNVDYLAYKRIYEAEVGIVKLCERLSDHNQVTSPHTSTDGRITEEQVDAINGVLSHSVSLLTAPGGAGKTSVVLKQCCKYYNNEPRYKGGVIIVVAPTHAAKKNAAREIGTLPQKVIGGVKVIYCTYAKLLYRYTMPGGKHTTCFLDQHIYKAVHIFVDESSMIGSIQFYELLNKINYYSQREVHSRKQKAQPAILNGCPKLTFIGDCNQIGPIPAGNPYTDLIRHGQSVVPTFSLTKNFRSEKSDIHTFSRTILGQEPCKHVWSLVDKSKPSYKKFNNVTYSYQNDDDEEKDTAIKMLSDTIMSLKKAGYKPYGEAGLEDKTFQVITLTNTMCIKTAPIVRNVYRGVNSQNLYTPGDIVVMRSNTDEYKNGDLGRIKHEHTNTLGVVVAYVVELLDTEMDTKTCCVESSELKPGLCRTVNSSQGMGFDVVVYFYSQALNDGIPLPTNMLNRNLNYTAYSRAKLELILMGPHSMFNSKQAREPSKIQTVLQEALKGNLQEEFELEVQQERPAQTDVVVHEEPSELEKENAQRLRKSIPKKVKNDVWNRHTGNSDSMTSRCFVCNDPVKFANFECGHVKSVADGGTNIIENLRVICLGCNRSMGTRDLLDYKKEYYG